MPLTCGELGRRCGRWPDGCGDRLECGNCESGRTCSVTGECVAACETASLLPGWPVDGDNWLQSTNTNVVDMDGDNRAEVLFALDNQVLVLGYDGRNRAGWPQQPLDDNYNAHTPAVGDIDGDGDREIVVAIQTSAGPPNAYIYAWHHDGALVAGWPVDLGSNSIGEVLLAELDKTSPGLEVVTVTDDIISLSLHVFRGDGSHAAGWPVTLPEVAGMVFGSFVSWDLAAGDLDASGGQEIIVTTWYSRPGVYRYDPSPLYVYSAGGAPVAGWPKLLGGMLSAPVLANIDDSPDLEILVGVSIEGASGYAAAFKHAGTSVPGWPVTTGPGSASVVVAELNGDGRVEVVAYDAYRGVLQAFARTGALLWRVNAGAYGLPAIGRIGAGAVGLFFPTESEGIDAIDEHGERLPGFPICLDQNAPGQPALGDLDGDGALDLVVVKGSRWPSILAYDLPYASAAEVEWPGFQRDARHSGAYLP